MAWITSATNGRALRKSRPRMLKVALLLAHSALLIALLRDRPPAGPAAITSDLGSDLFTTSAATALVALCIVLLLALLGAGGRAERQAEEAETSPALPDPSPIAVPEARAETAACDAHDGLLARLHHDLRTPLNAIIGFADLMQAETFGPLGSPRYRDYAAHMQECGQDLLRATETALAMTALLSRPGAASTETIALRPLVEKAWATATRAGEKASVELEVAVPADVLIRGDRAAFLQSLVCLFEAALTRCDAGSRLGFRADRASGGVRARLELDGARAMPACATTGCRPRTSSLPSIDELAIGVSRTLLAMQNAELKETVNTARQWCLQISLDDAAQSDFFDQLPPPSAARPLASKSTARRNNYGAGFFGALPISGSPSA